jgi:uncharacterized membrane protein (DUF373 family)
VASDPFDFLTVPELLGLFGAFLMVLIGLELLETVKVYAARRRVHVQAVLLVAMMAVLRKVITLDPKEMPAAGLLAVGALVLGLAGAYWLMRDARRRGPGALPPPDRT